jgi:hypothetical protein
MGSLTYKIANSLNSFKTIWAQGVRGLTMVSPSLKRKTLAPISALSVGKHLNNSKVDMCLWLIPAHVPPPAWLIHAHFSQCMHPGYTPTVGSESIAMFGKFGLFAVWCYTV